MDFERNIRAVSGGGLIEGIPEGAAGGLGAGVRRRCEQQLASVLRQFTVQTG